MLVDIEETHARPAAQNSQPGYSARKTRLSQPNDLYEQEADHMAEQALRMLAFSAAVLHIWAQRKQ